MSNGIKYTLAFLVASFALFLSPMARCSDVLTIDDAIQMAMDANPELASAGHELDAANARPPQAATPPDPKFMVDFIGVPTNTTDVSQGTIQYMGEQEIPFPTKLVYGYKAEKRAAEAAASRRTAAEQELTRRVKRAYFDLWRLGEEERIEREALSLFRQGKGSAIESYASLEAPISDPVRASVEAGDIEGKLTLIEQDRVTAMAELSRLMAKPLDPSVRLASPPQTPAIQKLDDLIAAAKEARPEIDEARSEVRSNEAKLSLAKSQYAPDFVFRLGYMDNPAGQLNAWYGRAGISVPLWSLSKQRFGVRESKALLASAQSQKDAAQLATESEVKTAHARLMAAEKTSRIYGGTVVPRARLLLSSSQEAYRSGKGDFLGIVDAIRSLSNAQLMYVRAKTDSAQAFADLERAVGTPLYEEEK
ncbi:MAG: TolC family protein [bacterium]